MSNPDHDRLLQQIARDVRFLSYRQGKPSLPILLMASLVLGLLLFVGAFAFLAELTAYFSGRIDENRPHTHQRRQDSDPARPPVVPTLSRKEI